MFKVPKIFLPKILCQTSSPISGEIIVTEDKNERRLIVGGYTQSIDKNGRDVKKRVWGKMAELALSNLGYYPKKILILGLGGGTLISLINKYSPKICIDVVELDPKIIEVSNKFFGPFNLNGGKIYCDDGYSFISNSTDKNSYDLIFVDVYLGGKFPENFESPEIFEGIKILLADNGLAVFNRIINITNNIETKNLEKKFLDHFKKVNNFKVGNFGSTANVIFICHS